MTDVIDIRDSQLRGFTNLVLRDLETDRNQLFMIPHETPYVGTRPVYALELINDRSNDRVVIGYISTAQMERYFSNLLPTAEERPARSVTPRVAPAKPEPSRTIREQVITPYYEPRVYPNSKDRWIVRKIGGVWLAFYVKSNGYPSGTFENSTFNRQGPVTFTGTYERLVEFVAFKMQLRKEPGTSAEKTRRVVETFPDVIRYEEPRQYIEVPRI